MNRDHSVIFEITSKYYIWRKGNSMNSMKRQNYRILKEESEKLGLKLNIQKTKIKAFGPITSWQIKEEKVKIVTDFYFLGV